MRTVSKALEILNLFGAGRSEMRSADVAKELNLDKSTCHRMLKVLSANGYLSKDDATKKYTLGPTVLRLARVRESITPVLQNYETILRDLTQQVEETSHASLIAGEQLASVAMHDGLKSNRVHHEAGVRLEWHATASGLACLAFAPEKLVHQVLSKPLKSFTQKTLTIRASILEELLRVRDRGYSIAVGTFDPDVTSISAPILDEAGLSTGAISVVVPSSRMTPEIERNIASEILKAARIAAQNEIGVLMTDVFPNVRATS